MQDALSFFEFGMDREVPEWYPFVPGLPVLHLGPGRKHIPDTIELEWPGWDADTDPLPYGDGTIGGVVATHLLEHLKDPRPLLLEIGRVLAPGAPFNCLVPAAGYNLFHQDLDHKTPFVLDTWRTLFDQSYYAKGKGAFNMWVGANMMMAVKEGNMALVTQLIKND